MVFFVHYGQLFGNPVITQFGQMGCQMFFVMSGFTCSYTVRKLNSTKEFYVKRLWSLLPGFYTVLILNIVANVACKALFNRAFIGGNTDPISVLCNALLIHGLLPFCQNNVFPGGWFIGAIVICYFLHPVIDKVYRKANHRWSITIVGIILMLFVTEAVNYIRHGTLHVTNNSFEYFLFTNQIGCYLLGIILFYCHEDGKADRERKASILIAMFSLILSVCVFYTDTVFSFVLAPTLVGIFTYFLYLSISEVKASGKFFDVICRAGKDSFLIYTTHMAALYFTRAGSIVLGKVGINGNALRFLILAVPSLIVTTLMGYVLKVILDAEKKVLKLK